MLGLVSSSVLLMKKKAAIEHTDSSTEFQSDQTELLFVITPRLVKPLAEVPRLPTDNHVVPSRAEVYFNGALESATPPADAATPPQAPAPASQQ